MAGSLLKLQHVPFFCILHLVLLLILPAGCQGKNPRMRDDYNFSASFDAINATTYRVFAESGYLDTVTRQELLSMSSESQGLVFFHHDDGFVNLAGVKEDRHNRHLYATDDEASFNVNFTIQVTTAEGRIPSTSNSLAFLILPAWFTSYYSYWDSNTSLAQNKQLSFGPNGSLILSDAVHRSDKEVSVTIARVPFLPEDKGYTGVPMDHHVLGVNITITNPAAAPANYTVWIEYNHLHTMSVYVANSGEAGNARARPTSPITSLENVRFNDTAYASADFAILSTMGQFWQIHSWSFWIEGLPDDYAAMYPLKWVFFALYYALPTAGTIILVATGAGVSTYLRSKQRRWKKEQEKLARTMQRLPGVPTQVDFAAVRKATASFHDTMKLGKGGFSSVYRCKLPAAAAAASNSRTSGMMEVAVKKFTREVEEERYEDFLAEVSIINRLRHKNIVPLVGWSYHKGVPLLIYEYMSNGSLDQHVFHQKQQQEEEDTSIRQWNTRYSIVRDIATGLHYVHHEHEPMVLHRDIKASNIMLDANFSARLGDFGIACTVPADKSSVTGIAGTWGYIAPDYAMSHRATRQTDIYAFGVLILEVVTGKKNRDVPSDDGHISDWVWRLHGEGKLLEAVDEHQQAVTIDEAERLLLLGLACTNPNPSDRPTMVEVVQVITKLVSPPDVPPEKPAFMWPPEESGYLDSDYSTTASKVGEISDNTVEPLQIIHEQPPPAEDHLMHDPESGHVKFDPSPHI